MNNTTAESLIQQILLRINKMTLLIDLYPQREINYLYRGKAFSDLGRNEEAIADYTKALELNPKNYNTFTNRGISYYQLGKKQEAILDYSSAICLRPFEKKNYYNRGNLVKLILLGKALYDLGHIEESIDDFSKAISISSKYAIAYSNRGCQLLLRLGRVLYELGKKQESLDDFSKAIKLKPNKANNYYNRGVVLRDFGKIQQAIADFSKAINLDPKSDLDFLSRGIIFKEKRQLQNAFEEFEKAINRNSRLDLAYYYRGSKQWDKIGSVHYELFRKDEAILDFTKAICLNSNNGIYFLSRGQKVFHYVGNIYQEKGFNDKAVDDYSQAIKLNSEKDICYFYRGIAYSELKKNEEALLDYSKAIQLNPNKDIYYYNRGTILSGIGQQEEAFIDLTKAINLSPNKANFYNNMGIIYKYKGNIKFQLGKKEEAIVDYSKAIQLLPLNENYYFNRANIMMSLGKIQEALIDYKKAHSLQPANPIYTSLIGYLYFNLRQFCIAFEYLTKASNDICKMKNNQIIIFHSSQNQIDYVRTKNSLITQIQDLFHINRLMNSKVTYVFEQKAQCYQQLFKIHNQAIEAVIFQKDNDTNLQLLRNLIAQLQKQLEILNQIDKNSTIKELTQENLNTNEIIYIKSFYGKLINYLKGCELFLKDPYFLQHSTIKRIAYLFGQVFAEGTNIFGGIRMSEEVFSIIGRAFNDNKNNKKFSDHIIRLANILKTKKSNMELEILEAGLTLAKLPQKYQINSILKNKYQIIIEKISQLEREQGLIQSYDEDWISGTDHCLYVLNFMEQNTSEIVKDKKKQLRDVIIEAIQNISSQNGLELAQTNDQSLIQIQQQ